MSAVVSLVTLLGVTSCFAAPAAAEIPHHGYEVFGRFAPTEIKPGGYGLLWLTVFNTTSGESAAPLTITDALPPGLTATHEIPTEEPRNPGEFGNPPPTENPACTTGTVVTCHIQPPPPLVFGNYPTTLPIPFEVTGNVETSNTVPPAPDVVELSGGEAAETVRATVPVSIGSGAAPPGFANVDGWLTDSEATTATQAGSHPFGFTFVFATNSTSYNTLEETPTGEPHTLRVKLPPGLVGNANTVPYCPRSIFDAKICPSQTQIGLDVVYTSGGNSKFDLPIYNLAPPPGIAAQFGFVLGGIDSFLDAGVATGSDYAITEEVVVPRRKVLQNVATIWGVPADINGGGEPPKAFLTAPTSCGTAPSLSAGVPNTWQEPEHAYPPSGFTFHDALDEPVGFSGCERLPFGPSITSRSTTELADSPSGLNFDLHMPDKGLIEPEAVAESNLDDTTVALPEGFVINPAVTGGLTACSPAQIGLKTAPGIRPIEFTPGAAECPESSKIGTVTVDTPLLDHPLPGSIYQAAQGQNPFGTTIAIYATVYDPLSGVVLKLPGEVRPDSVTGRVTSFFPESPQVPFEDFHLDFFSGAHAVFRTPPTCGEYRTTSNMTGWSGALASPVDSFPISNPASGRGPCPRSEGEESGSRTFSAGTLSTTAGAYSPLVFKVAREDGSQPLSRIETTLPKGLIGRLAGIPYCPEADIAKAEHRLTPGEGAVEKSDPSCPAASQIGTDDVGAGAGPAPVFTSGKVYLAGPYKGAPFSVEIITPAISGPFDFGAVAVRTAAYIDPLTAQVRAVSDPLPQILQGVPLDIRSVAVKMERPDFTLNPTSCDPSKITGQTFSPGGATTSLSNPFQVGECSRLGFKPALRLSLSGQTKRAGHPALKAVLTYPKSGSYANIAGAQVGLPGAEFLDQGNLNKVCKQAEISAGDCPAQSIYGHAKVWSPLLERPLEGPVYLGVGFGYKLPALVAELDGQIRVLLVGKVDTDKQHGIRNTFEAVPDAPVSKFELTLKGGKKYGLLENSEDICAKSQRATAAFTAQDGDATTLHPQVIAQCGKSSGKKKHKKGPKGRH